MIETITYSKKIISISLIFLLLLFSYITLVKSEHIGKNMNIISYSHYKISIPELKWDPKSHDFGFVQQGSMYNTSFEIWNNGSGIMDWQIDPCKDWVIIHPRRGSSSGERDIVNISIDTNGLTVGSYEGNAIIHAAGDYLFYTYFTITGAKLEINPLFYDFGEAIHGSILQSNFTIKNSGYGILNWSSYIPQDWLMIYPDNGTIETQLQNISIFVDTALVKNSYGSGTIFINSTGGCGVFTVYIDVNHIPSEPIISGPESFIKHTNHSFNISAKDEDNDSLYFFIDWGDNEQSGWIGPYPQNIPIRVNHTWNKWGNYLMKVRVMDDFGLKSNWTSIQITVPFSAIISEKWLYHFFTVVK